MAETLIRGINCPACGGSLEIVEGTVLLNCQYCRTGLLAKGERGISRFYVPVKQSKDAVLVTARKWLGAWNKAFDLQKLANFQESFLVHMPFWRVRATVVGCVLGDIKRGSGNKTTYEPVERRVLKRFEYTCPACDIGEFGVKWVELTGDEILPFNLEAVQMQGMTFEVLTTPADVIKECDSRFMKWAEDSAGVSRKTFSRLHMIGRTHDIIYYPLWILRYEYKKRVYQVTADAEGGELLYGRAPGNNLYRVACLIACIAAGNFMLTSVLCSSSSSDGESSIGFLVLCIGLMVFGFWKFRYGGEIKKEQKSKGAEPGMKKLLSSMKAPEWKELQSLVENIARKR